MAERRVPCFFRPVPRPKLSVTILVPEQLRVLRSVRTHLDQLGHSDHLRSSLRVKNPERDWEMGRLLFFGWCESV